MQYAHIVWINYDMYHNIHGDDRLSRENPELRKMQLMDNLYERILSLMKGHDKDIAKHTVKDIKKL